jgi:hypothetical protein
MHAFQVAALGHVPNDDEGFLSAKIAAGATEFSGLPIVAQGVGSLDGSAIELRYADHVNLVRENVWCREARLLPQSSPRAKPKKRAAFAALDRNPCRKGKGEI